jgi:hypothetical protein
MATAWEAARARYDNPGKNKGRMVPVRIAQRLPPGARYLELSGGGLSAEAVLAVRPDLRVVSADKDRALWPGLRGHARQFGYEAVCGSFEEATGLFDLIYLDLTGNTGKKADSVSIRLVHKAVKMLAKDGWLVTTITPDHELDSAVSLNRPVTVVSLLAAKTQMRVVGAMLYPNGDGKKVTVTVLRGLVASVNRPWLQNLDIYGLDEAMKRRGFWFNGQKDRGPNGFLFGTASQRYRADPKNQERIRKQDQENARRYYQKHRIRMQLDPEYARQFKERQRVARSTPEAKAKQSEYHRKWRDENRERWNAYRREWYQRKVTAVSGTAAEAISKAA